MGFGYGKSYRLGKSGVRLNVSKSGLGASMGVKGLRAGVGPRGARVTASIPGTGISYVAAGGTGRRGRTMFRAYDYPEVQSESLFGPLNEEFAQLVTTHPVTTREGRWAIIRGVTDLAWRLGQQQGRQVAVAGIPFGQPPVGDRQMLNAIEKSVRRAADTAPPTAEGVAWVASEQAGFAAQYGFIWGGFGGLSPLTLPVECKSFGVSPLALVVGLAVVVFLVVALI
jgi:hypothetical protein